MLDIFSRVRDGAVVHNVTLRRYKAMVKPNTLDEAARMLPPTLRVGLDMEELSVLTLWPLVCAENVDKSKKAFSDQMRKGFQSCPMPRSHDFVEVGANGDSENEDEVAIQEMETTMASALKRKRRASAKAKGRKAKAFAKAKAMVSKPVPAAVAKPVAEPKAKAAIAPLKSRQVILEGRMFTRLKVGGLSLVCVFHQNCTKDVTFGKHGQITEEEARRRLLAWEADWINYVENHHLAGGRLLGNYADCSHQFASSSSEPSR